MIFKNAHIYRISDLPELNGDDLQTQLEAHLRSEIRTTILGHTQRGGPPSPFDRNLATAFGAYAASMVADGQYGAMVALQGNRMTSVPSSCGVSSTSRAVHVRRSTRSR